MATKDLFHLIKSLSSHEKGYIKKHSAVHVIGDQNNYIKIFDAIDRQGEYKEEALHKYFELDPVENLPVAKNYLFRFILKCLESYHVNTKTELRSMLNQIEILYNKNLPGMARKMIAKAKIMAKQHELYEFMEEIIDWEIVFLVEEATPENYVELVNKYFGELNDSIEKKKTIINYKYLYQVLRAKALYKGLPRNDEDVLEVKKIARRAKRNEEQLLSTFNARFYRNLMRANYMFMTNEQKQANELMDENVRLLEEHPHMISLRPGSYLGMLRNKAVNELALMRYKTLFDTIIKMENFVTRYGHLNHSFEITVANLKLFVMIPSGQFHDALEVAQRLDLLYLLLPPTKSLEKEKHLQLYAFAYIYIGLGDYKEANAHINALLNASRVDVRSDLYCFANILSLIINFEMNNQELLQRS